MTGYVDPVEQALVEARTALGDGRRRDARRYAESVLQIEPESEYAWLILAATASPRASLAYLLRALEINPSSKRARRGMHWALQRFRSEKVISLPAQIKRQSLKGKQRSISYRRRSTIAWISLILIVLFISIYGFFRISFAWTASNQIYLPIANVQLEITTSLGNEIVESQPTTQLTDIPTATTVIESPTVTNDESPTQFPSPTPTLSPTFTATNLPDFLLTTKATNAVQNPNRPKNVSENEFWIDVDLSQQRLYAYQGDQLLDAFVVSTGLKATPTVTGHFRIYVKYRYASMSGPGYYLESVPFVMYFYNDYGLHGTYWHNNFGQPMSHGCVNLQTDDAAWVYKHAVVGTIVNIHR